MNHHGQERIGIGVIGAGARLCMLLEIFRRIAPEMRVTAIFDPSPVAVGRAQAGAGGGADVCRSPRELCLRDDVDWVFIGSPNAFHAEQAIVAFDAGKNVFCEKPLALSIDEAKRMHVSWQVGGRMFALGLVLRYSPLYRAARRAIEEGRIGHVLSFEFNETLSFNHGGYIHGNWRRFTRLAGSHLLEKCCHDLDLAMWLTDDRPVRVASFGGCSFFTPGNAWHQDRIGPGPSGEHAFQAWPDPDGVNPFTADKDIVDHQVAILEFGGGVRATFHTHCMAALPERRFYLLGTEGAMRLDAHTGKLEIRRVGWNDDVEVLWSVLGSPHAGADEPMCRELAECMAGIRPPVAGFNEGIRSLVAAQAIDQAMTEGRVVDLDPLWKQVAPLLQTPLGKSQDDPAQGAC